MATNPVIPAEKPWHAAYPTPQTAAASISRETLLSWFKDGKPARKEFILIDLRRTDFEGGTIHESINLPAQSLYDTIPSLYKLFSAAGKTQVIWYCNSSKGRGTRAAGWSADYLKSQNDSKMESLVLEGWATSGEEYVEIMDAYDAAAWKSMRI